MKNFIRWTLALAAVWTLAQWQSTVRAQMEGIATREYVVVTIHADGRCEVETQTVMGRQYAEQMVRRMEMRQKMEEADEDEDTPPGPPKPPAVPQADTNSWTDEQLKQKYMETMSGRASALEDEGGKFAVTVDKDSLTATATSSFASIGEFLQKNPSLSIPAVYFDNVRFEQDTNSHLVVTLTPNAALKRNLKGERDQWKMEGLNFQMKLVLPGKVLSSGFPETQTNATWLAVDSQKEETLDALAKLYEGPIVITAETAGLTLKEPIESKKLRRRGGRLGEIGDDLPITVAGPGFVAQAEGLTTTALHVFPGGSNFFEDVRAHYYTRPGTTVQAKLFPPKGRTLQTLTDLKLLAATDDKGRPVPAAEADGGEETSTAYVQSDDSRPQQDNSAQLQLRLQLPLPDAGAIDEISAEAVAVTAGSWKEITLSNITDQATNEMDIGGVLPGAKLVITKFSNKNNTLNLTVRIKGPATVRNLKVSAKIPGAEDRGFSSVSDLNVKTAAGETTRDIRINASSNEENGRKTPASFQLLIRYPQDLKRERVNFKLKGLDLL
jgi:hypothetical protein